MAANPERVENLKRAAELRQAAGKLLEKSKTNPALFGTYYNEDGELCPPPVAIVPYLRSRAEKLSAA